MQVGKTIRNIILIILCVVLVGGIYVLYRLDNRDTYKTITAAQEKEEAGAIESGDLPDFQPVPVEVEEEPAVEEEAAPAETTSTTTEVRNDLVAENIIAVSIWGDEFFTEEQIAGSFKNQLRDMLSGTGLAMNDYTLRSSGMLAHLRYAGVSDEIVEEYIEAHETAASRTGISAPAIEVSDQGRVSVARDDYANSIPIIFVGYYGGYNDDIQELGDQVQDILDTYAQTEEYIVIGLAHANGAVDQDQMDVMLGQRFGDHYITGEYSTPYIVQTPEGMYDIAKTVYDRMVNNGYI